MTGIDQPTPKHEPITPDAKFLTPQRGAQALHANIRVKVSFEKGPHVFGPWEAHRDMIRQQGSSEGGEIAGHAGIYLAAVKSAFQNYRFRSFGLGSLSEDGRRQKP